MHKFLFFFLLFPVISASSQIIQGSVKDIDGHILPFASILVKGTPMGVTANQEGKFEIHLKPGKYVLDCHYVGYTTSSKQIILDSESLKIDFVLTQQKLTLKEVVIKKKY